MREYRVGFRRAFPFAFFGLWGMVAFVFSPLVTIDDVPIGVRAAYGVAVGAILVGGWWWLNRVSVDLELRDGHLHWRTSLRSGSIHLADLVTVRRTFLLHRPPVVAVEHTRGRPVLVMVDRGLSSFIEHLADACPNLRVDLGGYLRRIERGFGRSG